MREVGARLARFSLPSIVALLTPFLVLPLIARIALPAEWLALAIGQSVGGLGALLVSQGYNLAGPLRVAAGTPAERTLILRRSLDARVLVLFPVTAACVPIAVLIAPRAPLIAGLSCAAFIAIGLSNAWYAVGCSEVRPTILFELAPRLLVSLAALPLIGLTGGVAFYPALLLAVNLLGPALFAISRIGVRAAVLRDVRAGARELLSHRHAMVSEVVGGTYTTLLVALVGASATLGQAAVYVSGDRLYRVGQNAVGTTANALQGWFAVDPASRRRSAIGVQTAIGAAGLLGLGLLGPTVSGLLFGARLAIDPATAWLLGGAMAMVSLNTATSRFLLLPVGRTRAISVSVVLGALVGVPAVLVGAHLLGAAGAAGALLVSETVVTATQLFSARATRSSLHRPVPGARLA